MQSGSVTSGAANTLEPLVSLTAKVVDFGIQGSNHFERPVDGSFESTAFALPAVDSFDLGSSSSHLGVDLLTELALLADGHSLHDEFHAASLASAVLAVAVLSKVSPLPIATDKAVLIEEAHGYGCLIYAALVSPQR